ncbi:tetratricopeptide repeat protein [Methanosarcina sp. MSH10X1]|nr:tetratricopeptide repeat protein [Methanosarcina sp. MSH10X1]
MLNNLGTLLSDMGRIEEAKQRYEKALDMREKLR